MIFDNYYKKSVIREAEEDDEDDYSVDDPDDTTTGDDTQTDNNDEGSGDNPEPSSEEDNPEDTSNEDDYSVDDEDESSDGEGEEGADNSGDDNPEDTSEEDDYSIDDEGDGDSTGDGEGDDNIDGPSDDDSEVDPSDPRERLKALEKSIFDTLSPEQQAAKTKELKDLYTVAHTKCQEIIDAVSGAERDAQYAKIYDYIISRLSDLKTYIIDYLSQVFDSKTYLENMTEYQKYLAVFDTIKNIFDEIQKSKDSAN